MAALFARFRPDEAPPFDLSLDHRVVIFGGAASLISVVLFGLAPALQTTRPDVGAELKGVARPFRARRFRLGLRDGLVVVQVALSAALIVGATLLLRSTRAGRVEDIGATDSAFADFDSLGTIGAVQGDQAGQRSWISTSSARGTSPCWTSR